MKLYDNTLPVRTPTLPRPRRSRQLENCFTVVIPLRDLPIDQRLYLPSRISGSSCPLFLSPPGGLLGGKKLLGVPVRPRAHKGGQNARGAVLGWRGGEEKCTGATTIPGHPRRPLPTTPLPGQPRPILGRHRRDWPAAITDAARPGTPFPRGTGPRPLRATE